jgi:hypothetical protein
VPARWLEFVAGLPEGDSFRKVVERRLDEVRFTDLPEQMQIRGRGRLSDAERDFQDSVGTVMDDALTGLVHAGSGGHNGMNGNGTINGSPT